MLTGKIYQDRRLHFSALPCLCLVVLRFLPNVATGISTFSKRTVSQSAPTSLETVTGQKTEVCDLRLMEIHPDHLGRGASTIDSVKMMYWFRRLFISAFDFYEDAQRSSLERNLFKSICPHNLSTRLSSAGVKGLSSTLGLCRSSMNVPAIYRASS